MGRAALSDAAFDATLPSSAGGSGKSGGSKSQPLDTGFGASVERPFKKVGSAASGAVRGVSDFITHKSADTPDPVASKLISAPRMANMHGGYSEALLDQADMFHIEQNPSKPLEQMTVPELRQRRADIGQRDYDLRAKIAELTAARDAPPPSLATPTAPGEPQHSFEPTSSEPPVGYTVFSQGRPVPHHPPSFSPSLTTYGGTASRRMM